MRTFIRHLNKYIINTSLVVQILSCRWYYHSTCILCVSNCVSVCTGGVGVGLLCRLILSYDPMTRWYTATNTVFKSHLLYTSVKKDFGLETMINPSCAWLTNALCFVVRKIFYCTYFIAYFSKSQFLCLKNSASVRSKAGHRES